MDALYAAHRRSRKDKPLPARGRERSFLCRLAPRSRSIYSFDLRTDGCMPIPPKLTMCCIFIAYVMRLYNIDMTNVCLEAAIFAAGRYGRMPKKNSMSEPLLITSSDPIL